MTEEEKNELEHLQLEMLRYEKREMQRKEEKRQINKIALIVILIAAGILYLIIMITLASIRF